MASFSISHVKFRGFLLLLFFCSLITFLLVVLAAVC